MQSGKCVQAVQVLAGLSGGSGIVRPETDFRLIAPGSDAIVTWRRVVVKAAIRTPETRSALCASLHRRRGIVAVPSPQRDHELLVLESSPVAPGMVRTGSVDAELREVGDVIRLRLEDARGRAIIASLLERTLIVAFEDRDDYRSLSSSTRIWYAETPVATTGGIEVMRQISFSTPQFGEKGVGVVLGTIPDTGRRTSKPPLLGQGRPSCALASPLAE